MKVDKGGCHFILAGQVLSPSANQNEVLQSFVNFRSTKQVIIEKKHLEAFLDQYRGLADSPPLSLPPEHNFVTEILEPKAILMLFPEQFSRPIAAELWFDYPFGRVNFYEDQQHWLFKEQKKRYSRSQKQEETFYRQLFEYPGFDSYLVGSRSGPFKVGSISPNNLSNLVERLEACGWQILAEGKPVRVANDFDTIVEGTIDWLDVNVVTEIDGQSYSLPEILSLKNFSKNFINLGKNGFAVLPEKWLKQIELLETSGRLVDGVWRFPGQQAILLDAMLLDQPVVSKSELFTQFRARSKNLDQPKEMLPAAGFQGQLRSYQREGLAWLYFLKELRLGGCLADDMGLGKTIQVLALLWTHYQEGESSEKPSLIVVPRSLVGNWMKEAASFCPKLSFIDNSQGARNWSSLTSKTVYVTTYGVLRQDIIDIVRHSFAFAVLDESQTVKNAKSLAAKAVRTLRADYRVALSGTPIENHLGELASLFGFLNPGLLEASSWKTVLQKAVQADDPRLQLLKKALKPLFLRRTKEQVLKDLPPKIEQTIECEMEPEQARHYQQLLSHYRLQLLPGLKEESWRSSSFVILEALLRLRQAACHPGLVDARYVDGPSSKIDEIVERLIEVTATGHKALVFSQFTSLLKILAKKLEKESIAFEYLDGKSRQREASVERFQNDPKMSVIVSRALPDIRDGLKPVHRRILYAMQQLKNYQSGNFHPLLPIQKRF